MKNNVSSKISLSLMTLCSVLTFGGAVAWSPSAKAQIDPFIAEIVMFGGNFAPRGWAFCDGQLLPIANNTALFSLLGTTYGGDGRTTFGVPDLRGRVPMHKGRGTGLSNRTLGQKGGAETVTLTENQMPSHSHSAASTATTTSALKATTDAGTTNIPTGAVLADDGNDRIYKNTNTVPNVDMSPAAIVSNTDVTTTIGSAGGSESHTNVQPFQVVNFIIALVGTFPSRN